MSSQSNPRALAYLTDSRDFYFFYIFVDNGKEESFKIFLLLDYGVVFQAWTETDGIAILFLRFNGLLTVSSGFSYFSARAKLFRIAGNDSS